MAKLLLILMTVCVAASAQPRVKARADARPDVILVTIDTLRADHVGCYGYTKIKTPSLDQLCRDGVRFTDAITAAPITNTAHASILTGLYPSNHGVSDFAVPLSPAHVTIAKLLQQQGYRTAAFIGAVILDSKTLAPGFGEGFQSYANFPNKSTTRSRWERVERRATDVVKRANTWLASNRVGPRFAWIHLYDPHDPYEPPAPYDQQYKGHEYDGEIAYADSALGELLAEFKKEGRYDSSLVIVLGDHGEGLGEHNEKTHGIFLYDSTLHIPLIVKRPGNRQKGASVSSQVSSVDVVPTILDELNIQTKAKFDGISLFQDDHQAERRESAAISETDYPLRFGWAPLKSVRMDGSKYIEAPRPEMYSLKSDPSEQHNIYQPWDPELQKLRAALAEFRTVAAKNASQEKKVTAGATPASTVEELRALGYLGNVWGSTTAPEPSLLPDPKDRIEVQNLIHEGMMQDESGNAAAARQAFVKALEAEPNSLITLSQLGELEFRSGDFRGAATHLSTAQKLNPQDAGIALHLGQSLQHTGELARAAEALDTALKLSPGQYDARTALGEIYLTQNKLDAAQDQLEAAILLDGKRPEARIALARLFLQRNDAQEARKQIEEVLRSNPGNKEAISLLKTLMAKAE